MSSSSTADNSTAIALDHVLQELDAPAGGSSSNVLLKLGAAGYTAPPPTPMASATVALMQLAPTDNPLPSTTSTSEAAGSSAGVTRCAPDEGYGGGDDDDEKGGSSTQLAAPSRAELDALAHYLLQQSLGSTPTLRLAESRGSQQRKRRSLTGNPQAIKAASTHIDMMNGEKEHNGKSIAFDKQHAGNADVGAAAAAAALVTYSYSGGSMMSTGLCEESKRGIRRACEEEMGAFYINIVGAVQEMMNEESDAALLPCTLLLRHMSLSSNVCVGSGPLVPLSEFLLITPAPSHDPLQTTTCTLSSLQAGDDTFELLYYDLPLFLQDPQACAIHTNFRETMTKYAKVLFEISKDLIKLLLEDLCIETQANIRAHYMKPLLHIYNNGKHEKSNDVRHDDDDVVLSLSHDIVNHQGNKSVLLLARVGNQLQTWSKGKYKASSLNSLCNPGNGDICMQLDLIEYH